MYDPLYLEAKIMTIAFFCTVLKVGGGGFKKDGNEWEVQGGPKILLLVHCFAQFYQQESAKLSRQIREIENSNRNILGEAIGSLAFKELKALESRLEKALTRIRSKKEVELQQANMYLRSKVSLPLYLSQREEVTFNS
ncbi:hypothetical protein RJ639_015815 [Escallonia herrerae]|uniref:K-box domain-containing protein n=1 Tax=Escallonia herrerae TaxID=1293975 RepID=A0AA89AM80_9ASTE|nr:hypothetical protein RJ639_015815 [Escallonia herrerae]